MAPVRLNESVVNYVGLEMTLSNEGQGAARIGATVRSLIRL